MMPSISLHLCTSLCSPWALLCPSTHHKLLHALLFLELHAQLFLAWFLDCAVLFCHLLVRELAEMVPAQNRLRVSGAFRERARVPARTMDRWTERQTGTINIRKTTRYEKNLCLRLDISPTKCRHRRHRPLNRHTQCQSEYNMELPMYSCNENTRVKQCMVLKFTCYLDLGTNPARN